MEIDFADEEPLARKSELQFHVASKSRIKVDRNVPGPLQHHIRHVNIFNRILSKVAPSDAEIHLQFCENLLNHTI